MSVLRRAASESDRSFHSRRGRRINRKRDDAEAVNLSTFAARSPADEVLGTDTPSEADDPAQVIRPHFLAARPNPLLLNGTGGSLVIQFSTPDATDASVQVRRNRTHGQNSLSRTHDCRDE